jgi:DNA-nicking Smr family endonuclease
MKQPIDKEDIELFRKSVGKVKPLSQDKMLLSQPKQNKKQSAPSNTHTDIDAKLYKYHLRDNDSQIGPHDVLIFKRDGLQNKVLKRLKKGQVPVIAELDLHGHTINKAKLSIDRFILQNQNIHTPGCIRIIHGKGYGSQDATPVIKQYIPGWLQEYPDVLAYCSCPVSDGGTGAVYVLMKRGQNY